MRAEDFIHLIPRMEELVGECKPDALFCLYCIDTTPKSPNGWMVESSIKSHLTGSHPEHCVVDPVAGVDYLVGHRMNELLAELRVLGEKQAAKLALQLETITTVDDFLTDCGEEPWPEMELDE